MQNETDRTTHMPGSIISYGHHKTCVYATLEKVPTCCFLGGVLVLPPWKAGSSLSHQVARPPELTLTLGSLAAGADTTHEMNE